METADLTHHISRRFNEDLEKVRNQVLQMGGFVEQQLHKAITALVEGDSRLGESVATDDYKVNGMEVSIDEECSRILALRAPAAGDLRVIVAIIKTITDLERIGDEGEKIGYIASRLATMERPADKYREVKHLGRQVAQMVHDALTRSRAWTRRRRCKTAQEDRMVDEEYESIQRQCMTFMMEDPRSIRRALEIMWIVRALERIGDHAKNICEYVIYMVHGKDVRHTSLDDVAKQIDVVPECRADDRAACEFTGLHRLRGAVGLRVLSRSSCCISTPARCASSSASAFSRSGVVFAGRGDARSETLGPEVYAAALALAALATIGVAIRQLYIQSLPPGHRRRPAAPRCDFMLKILPLKEVLVKVLSGSGECAKVDWRLLGLAMPAWVLIAAVGSARSAFGRIRAAPCRPCDLMSATLAI